MRKENMSLLLGLIILTLIIGVVYYFVSTPGPAEDSPTSGALTQPSVAPGQQASPADGMNPNYGDLREEDIRVADIAIGKLLNNSQGISPPMITVKDFQEKDFADASLDCPQPEQMYAQVITPGYQVILEAQGKEYDYRLTNEENVILCEL